MRLAFSLKWMLVGVTYASLSAAALSQNHPLWENFLWLLTGALVAYAVLAAGLLRGRGQALALGFALFASTYGLALWWFPQLSPVSFIAYVAGFVDPAGNNLEDRTEARLESMRYEMMIASRAANEQYRQRVLDRYQKLQQHARWYASLESYEASLNAIGVGLAGLVGCLAGASLYASRS